MLTQVVKNLLWNMGYQVFILLLPILTIPYVSRVLGPTGIGINAFTNSIVQYFVLFGTLGMTMYGNREVAYQRDQPEGLSNLFWELSVLRFVTTTIATMVYLAFIFLSGEYQLFYLIQGLFLIANAVDISWFFQGLEEFRITVLRNTLVKIVSLVLIFVLIRTKDDLWLYILILSGSQVLGNLTLFPYLRRYISRPHWSNLTLKRHFRPTLEMFVPQIATQVYLQLNKTMLGALIGVQASGFYDNSDKIVKIILAVVTATGTVLLPHSAHSYSQGRYDIIETSLDRSMHFILLLAFPLATGLAGVAPLFTHIFFGKGFSPVSDLLIIESIVIVLVGISNAVGVQYLLPTNQLKTFTTSVIFGALVNIFLNLPLILLFQSDGAMVATVLSELLVTVYQLIKVKQQIDVFKLFREVWKYAFSAFAMGILVRIFTMILPIQSIALLLLAVLWGGVVYFLILGLLRPHELMQMILVLRKKSE
ncbi:flippase [Lacticaseibacillus rhamnosus]|uniref:flippase n=1 Tax=Lacticaseibacillus rhamnosus TaxID=47715 RepID=UPI0021503C6A|nr:flippase [Lacticaseibacillus rhamnosus]MDB7671928.1 flippase [Lacticaseibacillus rhamnosus]MDB7757462.1 flippase [Lacticaseibacillus rhamnosus]MDB7763564.1 flippase [Lacticaseibacillus rhamnosus]MDB7766768.1 flippase [Lacticaseibacillus rhamnosus]MDB7769856.1 flippase [Lacticaseibacillus rhamnosus]